MTDINTHINNNNIDSIDNISNSINDSINNSINSNNDIININNNNNKDSDNNNNSNDSSNNNEEKKLNCLFKKPIKQRGNIRKKSEDQMLNNNSNNNSSGDSNNNNNNNNEEEDDNSNNKNKKKLKINQYTTKQEKKNEFSFDSTGIAGSTINSADLSTTEYHNEEDEYENTVLASRGLKKDEYEKQKQSINNDDGIYRGMNSYSTYVEKKSDLSYKGGGVKAGPIKTVANVKLASRIDYQPDVCKDYKQTGQCTFGDACKFLHDRTDYKSGWQIDKEWEEEQKLKKLNKDSSSSIPSTSSSSEELPFACFICKNQFDNPVMTKCKHFFCESCALEHNRKNKKCAVCGEPTQGIFSQPKKTIEKLLEVSKAHFKS